MTSVFLLLWMAQVVAASPADIQQVACLQDGTIVGTDVRYMLRRWHDGGWTAPEGTAEVRELWTTSTGAVYARENGPVIANLRPGMSSQAIPLPPTRATSLAFSTDATGAVYVASPEKIFRLKPDATATEVGPPPPVEPGSEFRPSQAPVVFAAVDGWIACFPNSSFEIDNGMKGTCLKTGNSPYNYRADFGRYSDRTRSPPFVCGDALVSSIGQQTQARRLSDGRRVGAVPGPARVGSRCLADGHVLLVGPDGLRVFDGPALRRPRIERVRGKVRDVAVCSKQFALLLEDSTIALIDRSAQDDHRPIR